MTDNEDIILNPVKDLIKEWVLGPLSRNHISLNNLPPCPFAKEALIKKEILIEVSDDKPGVVLRNILNKFDEINIRVAVVAFQKEEYNAKETQDLVQQLRSEYSAKNLWVMYDHPEIPEFIDDLNLSFGHSILYFIQKLDDVCEHAKKLEEKGYYQNWPSEYYEKVVAERERKNQHREDV